MTSSLERIASARWLISALRARGLHLIDVLEHGLDRAPLLDERERALVTDAFHARHVVRGVADEREVVHDALRRDAQSLVRVLETVPLLGGASRRAVPGIQHPHALVDELQQILVAGDDADLEACRNALWAKRGDDVVGLEAVELQRRDLVAGEQLLHALDARIEVLLLLVRQCDAIGLVRLEEHVATGGAGIIHPADVLRLVLLEKAPEKLADALGHARVLAARVP